jgi:predicted RND superfamily exporter protein
MVIAMAVILGVAPGIARLRLRADGHALLSPDAQEVRSDSEIRNRFGVLDNLVVLIRSAHPNGVFNAGTIQLIRDMTAELAQAPGIDPRHVLSLATEASFRFRPGTFDNEGLLEPLLTNNAELNQLREDVRRIELYTGTLVSADETSTVILVGVPPGADRALLYGVVSDIALKRKSRAPSTSIHKADEIVVTGAPAAEALLGLHILEDLGIPRKLLELPVHHDFRETPTGLPWLKAFVTRRIGLVPIAVLVMLLVLYASFRNLLAAVVPVPGVLAALVFVFGLMGWIGVPIYLTMAVTPVLLATTSIINDLYLFNRYFALLRQNPEANHLELLNSAFDHLVPPVAMTSLTTAAGFFSFSFSPMLPVRAFGVITGIGVLFGLLYSLTVVPAVLAMLRPPWLLPRWPKNEEQSVSAPRSLENIPGQSALARFFKWLGGAVIRSRGLLAAALLLLALLAPLGLWRLRVQDSWIDGFDRASEFRLATDQVNERFHGMHLLLVSFDARDAIVGEVAGSNISSGAVTLPPNIVPDPALITGSSITLSVTNSGGGSPAGPSTPWTSTIKSAFLRGDCAVAHFARTDLPSDYWQKSPETSRIRFELVIQTHFRPEVIRAIANLAAFIRERRQDAVGGVISPAEYLLTTRFMLHHTERQPRQLPADPGEARLLWNYYGAVRGTDRLRQAVDTNYWQSLTTVFLKQANFIGTAKLMDDIRHYEKEHLTPKGVRLGFAGDVALSQSLIRSIVTTQLKSLVWSLAGIYLLTALLFGSWRWGAYCTAPSLVAIIIKFALMGLTGIPLGVATSMFAAMTLGIGVNCAIHLLSAYLNALPEGISPSAAISQAMALTGPPAFINTLALSLGFGAFLFSQIPANWRLGFLLVLGLAGCFIATVLMLPILLYKRPTEAAT